MVVVEKGYSKERAKALKEKHIYALKDNGYSIKNEASGNADYNILFPISPRLRVREKGKFLRPGERLLEFAFSGNGMSIEVYNKKLLPEMEAFAKDWEEYFGGNTAKITTRY